MIAGVVAAAAGIVVALLGGSIPLSVAGWLLAGPVGLTLLAWYLNRDSRARVSGVYTAPSWVTQVYVVAVVFCLAAVAFTAIWIAMGVGRL